MSLELGLGGRLDVELSGKPTSENMDAAREWFQRFDPGLREWNHRSAKLWLERRGLRHEPFHWLFNSGLRSCPSWPYPLDHRRLGSRETSMLVPTGGFTLVARMPSGREVRRDVTIRAGEVTRVEIKL
ncbi:MAG: hypothetical protein ACI835_004251 [Planctomycetota bacterium]|jgi:hypothetical protein